MLWGHDSTTRVFSLCINLHVDHGQSAEHSKKGMSLVQLAVPVYKARNILHACSRCRVAKLFLTQPRTSHVHYTSALPTRPRPGACRSMHMPSTVHVRSSIEHQVSYHCLLDNATATNQYTVDLFLASPVPPGLARPAWNPPACLHSIAPRRISRLQPCSVAVRIT